MYKGKFLGGGGGSVIRFLSPPSPNCDNAYFSLVKIVSVLIEAESLKRYESLFRGACKILYILLFE
jgi:hypothetical protein